LIHKLLLFAFLIAVQSPSNRVQQQSAPAKQNTAGQSKPEPKPEATKSVSAIEDRDKEKASQPATKQQSSEANQVPSNRGSDADWAMVKVTAAGIAIALITLGCLLFQTIATKEAANAAKESADFLRFAERAWVLIERVNLGGPRYALRISNCGKTPARIIFFSKDNCLVSASNPIPDTPFIKESSDLKSPFVLAPGKEDDLDEVHFIHFTPAGGASCYWGEVRYADVFDGSETHITRFGYIYEHGIGEAMRVNNPEYNKNT
jgi:hypothetical protein